MQNVFNLRKAGLATIIGLLSACGAPTTKEPTPTQSAIPDWVASPKVENGLADTQCVVAYPNANEKTLKDAATVNGRAELLTIAKAKAKSLDSAFQQLSASSSPPTSETSFATALDAISPEEIQSARTVQTEFVDLPPEGKTHLCVMVALSAEQTRSLFEQLISNAGVANLSVKSESELYQHFLNGQSAD